MTRSIRITLLTVSAIFMIFGAVGYGFVLLPDLHGDLIEIGVRPRVLGSTVLHLQFAAIAMFGFALMVVVAAIQEIRGVAAARAPLAIVALIYLAFGAIAFSRSRSPHQLGTLVVGAMLGAALVLPRSEDPAR